MKNVDTFSLVALPSVTSFLFTLSTTIIIAVISVWGAVQNLPIVRDTVDSLFSQSEIITSATGSLEATAETVLGSSAVNEIFYILMWALVGVLVYFAGVTLGLGNQHIFDVISPRGKRGRGAGGLLLELISRTVFRLFIFIIWSMFAIVAARFLIPMSITSIKAASGFSSLDDAKFLILGIIVLFATIHLQVVLIRLFLLRVRVFGQADVAILNN